MSLPALAVALAAGVVLAGLTWLGLRQSVAAIFVTASLLLLVVLDPRIAISSLFVFMATMGDFRRLLIADVSNAYDPILLVAPAIATVLISAARSKGFVNRQSRTAKLVFALTCLMFVEILNPLQGGLAVGLAGGLFYLAPVIWFWIGQAWGSDKFVEKYLLRLVLVIALLASPLGIYQAFYGLLPFEEAFFRNVYNLKVVISGSTSRPMSFFISSSEYTQYLSIAMAVALAAVLSRRAVLFGLLLPVFAAAALLSGVRGPIASAAVVLVMLWAIQSRNLVGFAFRFAVAGVAMAVSIVWGLQRVQSLEMSPQVASLLQHQAEGIVNISDSQKSSAAGHLIEPLKGLAKSFTAPFGRGLGATSMAAAKFQGELASATEMDVSDMSVALGPIGGLIYVLIGFYTLRNLVLIWRRQKRPAALILFAVLIASVGRWTHGSQYVIAVLCWFCIGAADRLASRTPMPTTNDDLSREPRQLVA